MDLPLFFISDVHLRLATVETEKNKRENLINFIDHVAEQGGSLFIVGDFFDFWFEYKYVIPKAYFEILSALQEAKRIEFDSQKFAIDSDFRAHGVFGVKFYTIYLKSVS